MGEFSVNAAAKDIYFSDHDAITIVIEKDNVGFQTIP